MTIKLMTALERAVAIVGGEVSLGKKINRSQGSISRWLNRPGRRRARGEAPGEVCGAIEAASGVPKWQLRPDLYEEPQA